MLTTPIGMTPQLPESVLATLAAARPHLLLIEPPIASLPGHQFLSSNVTYEVTSVSDMRELGCVSPAESFALAVISDTLGPVGLRDAARSVRKHWPSARILVLGLAALILDDHLYDNGLPNPCSQQVLSETLVRMSGPQIHRRPFIVTATA